jgi:hypothetical protein
MYIAVNGGSTNIHSNVIFVDGFEEFFFAGKGVV